MPPVIGVWVTNYKTDWVEYSKYVYYSNSMLSTTEDIKWLFNILQKIAMSDVSSVYLLKITMYIS